MFRYLRSKLPRRHRVVRHWSIKPFAHHLKHPRHWHIHRMGVSRAIFIGLLCAWVPIPGTQMLVAALWAAIAKANIPSAVAATWISNPFTFVPFYYAAFWLGDRTMSLLLPFWESVPFTFDGIWSKESALIPTLLGTVFLAVVSAYAGYSISKYLWRRHIIRKRAKQLRLRASKRVVMT
ncbi:MAG: DUF2062 domain-containing protein [Gammaproteobacteria bacterium]|nr:DUF2062 domain-containing protein [Gammaproteobacteria bacterium]